MVGCTMSWIYSALFASLFLSFFLFRRKRMSKLPPGPPGWPIVGNLLQLGKRPHESLFHLAQKYGALMILRLGMKTAVVVSSPAMAEEFLKNNDHIFAGRPIPQSVKCDSFYNTSLSGTPYGPRWRMLRRICSVGLFSAKRLNALQHLRRDQVFETIRLIHAEGCLKGKAVNIGDTAFLVSLNLIGNMIFSCNIFGQDSEAAEEFKETVSKTMEILGTPNLADYFPFLQILDPQGISRDMKASLKRVYALLDKFIDARISPPTQSDGCAVNHGDFLDVLLDCRNDSSDESSRFTRTDINALLYTLFLAGSDTSGTTIEWAMAEILRNPQVMRKAQAELQEVVGSHRKVEESDVQHLRYLKAVVKEVFRLHPAAPLLLPHRAESSCEIAGFEIPKHSPVMVNVWGMGRDPSVWERPLEFDPERFVQREMEYKGNDFQLIPFGAGRRMCPGLPLGSAMVHFFLASLLHSFDLVSSRGAEVPSDRHGRKVWVNTDKSLPSRSNPYPSPSHRALLNRTGQASSREVEY